MALLNFAKTYKNTVTSKDISAKIGLQPGDVDYLKLYFTGDGHIVTHGVDFTPLMTVGKKGLVSAGPSDLHLLLRGDNTWKALERADIPTVSDISDLKNISSKLFLDSEQTLNLITSQFSANDAMRFKGSISIEKRSGDSTYSYYTNGKKGFPTSCEVGDTYRIASPSVSSAYNTMLYGGHQCQVGDLIMCIKAGGSNINSSTYWTAVETNINGTATLNVNGSDYIVYSNNPTGFTIFAPKTGGTDGYVLQSKGATTTPEWVTSTSLVAGDLTDTAKKGLFTGLTAANGRISITVGGTNKEVSPSGSDWNISILGSANNVRHSLSAGTGLKMTASFNGSADQTMSLIPATVSTLGGVIVDSGAREGISEVKPTISVDNSGKIYLSQQNIINALGFNPEVSGAGALYQIIISKEAGGENAAVSTANPFITLLQTLKQEVSSVGSIQLNSSGGISVSSSGTVITFTLKEAAADHLGGIKLGYTDTADTFAVKLDSNNLAYVKVPWRNNDTYLVSDKVNGLVPKIVGNNTAIDNSYYVLASKGISSAWHKLPTTAFSDTWRAIKVNGTQILASSSNTALNLLQSSDNFNRLKITHDVSGNVTFFSDWRDIQINGAHLENKSLNIMPSQSISLMVANPDDVSNCELSFGLNWYNVDDGTVVTIE